MITGLKDCTNHTDHKYFVLTFIAMSIIINRIHLVYLSSSIQAEVDSTRWPLLKSLNTFIYCSLLRHKSELKDPTIPLVCGLFPLFQKQLIDRWFL